MGQYSKHKKRGCPTCDGVDAKTCMRCRGKTRMCDWWNTPTGWAHESELTAEEIAARGASYVTKGVEMHIHNRADGVDGHYCIARHNEGGFSEFWTEHSNSFTSAGTVYVGEETALAKLEELLRSCDNCNQVYEREYSNGGKQCFGLVKDTFHDCDVIRACQKYDNGKMFLQDLSPDEAAEMATGYSAAIRTWFSFFYQRPCGTCGQKESDCNVAE